ncbi:hypothetical protein CVT24_001939 [Panaeolus cyanescens]|uniref:Ndc10 domain-containing protein n=1 Tax=Panaeolus cyanescens TaxID=181874 RepID=A0A409YHX1_9AGAR|nr:hypothetical protein CVT24_001939 [Panaeolus cyanescens]
MHNRDGSELNLVAVDLDQQHLTIEDRVHAEALKRQGARQADRATHGTERAYPRHVKNYVEWWEADQLRLKEQWNAAHKDNTHAQADIDPGDPASQSESPQPFPYTPPHPITSSKVCLFLNYELNREKRTVGGKSTLPNTTVGVSSIKQTISSLEQYRFRHCRDPEYQAEPASQIKLRDDPYIQDIERSAQLNEAKRQEATQEMKAKGLVSATFTMAELVLMSKDYFLNPLGPSKRQALTISLRNRTMLLFSTSMAFRGDNTCRILLSDLNIEEVPMPSKDGTEVNKRVKALVVMSNQGKTNTTGRIDKQYAFRHHDVFGRTRPDFEPVYTDKRSTGNHGYRAWYLVLLFSLLSSPDCQNTEPMTYENHRKQCNDQKERLQLTHRSVTHGGRSYTATVAIANGSTTDSVRALGNWSFSGSWSLYNYSLPIDAMVAAAGFNGQQVDSYFIARDAIGM